MTPFTNVVYVYSNISLSKGHLGSRGGGGEASNKQTERHQFHCSNDKDTFLSIFHTHVQKEYHKVLELKSTSILNILELLLFEN